MSFGLALDVPLRVRAFADLYPSCTRGAQGLAGQGLMAFGSQVNTH
jgi:hypothetical protein